jgi:hypothetical protein
MVLFVTPILIVASMSGVWFFREETKVPEKTRGVFASTPFVVGALGILDPCLMMMAGSTPVTKNSFSCQIDQW